MVSRVEFSNDILLFLRQRSGAIWHRLTGHRFEMWKFVLVACLFSHAMKKINPLKFGTN